MWILVWALVCRFAEYFPVSVEYILYKVYGVLNILFLMEFTTII